VPIDRDDLNDLRDHLTGLFREDIRGLSDTVREGFRGVHSRQDTTNGRLNTHEGQIAALATKVLHVEGEVFTRRATDRAPLPLIPPATDSEQKWVSNRDVRIVVATLIAVSATITFVQKVWPLLAALVKAGP
jgi:hypothetical protein